MGRFILTQCLQLTQCLAIIQLYNCARMIHACQNALYCVLPSKCEQNVHANKLHPNLKYIVDSLWVTTNGLGSNMLAILL